MNEVILQDVNIQARPVVRQAGYPSAAAWLYISMCVFLLTISALLSNAAIAQDTPADISLAPEFEDAFRPAEPVPEEGKTSEWQVQAGALFIYWPEYIGDDEYEALALPLFVLKYRERYYFHYIDGLGIHLVNTESFRLSTGISYAIGREESDSPHLSGLGDIDPGTIFNVLAEYTRHGYSVAARFNQSISGDDIGLLIDLDLAYTQSMSERLLMRFGVTSSYADADYMQSFFGVSDIQALNSGLVRYETDAGIKSSGVQITSVYFFSSRWNLQGQLKYERLLGDAADSPVVQDDRQYILALGLAYLF